MSALDEVKYFASVSEFVSVFNERMRFRVKNNDTWVRVSPPDKNMLVCVQQDPRVLPFTRVGTSGKVTDVSKEFVTIQIGEDSLVFSHLEFFRTFVRIVDPREWVYTRQAFV